MNTAVLFVSVLSALIAASECQKPHFSPPRQRRCPPWCPAGAQPGSVCAPGCVCAPRQNRGPFGLLLCNPRHWQPPPRAGDILLG
ncbi:hypothetical protein V5799_034484 [Amblyomma americanum]|uniref:Secreted protein n=1 Tax=Amblyomma americanum TaxID=6943 RepID=A0AAQ4DKB7_AMBAM